MPSYNLSKEREGRRRNMGRLKIISITTTN